jgi:amino acid transporter
MSKVETSVLADPPNANGPQVGRLARNSMSGTHLVFTVLAALAPLTLVVAVAPLHFLTGGAAVPGGFILAGCIMGMFAVSFSAMTRYVKNAGAFYAVITRGLGREAGAGAAMLAMVAYNALQISTYGAFGVFAAEMSTRLLGITLPWWVFAGLALIAVGYLGYKGIETSARVLMVVLTAEIAILLVLCGSILVQGGTGDVRYDILAPSAVLRPENGGMLALVIGAFMGFESTAIFSEEAKGGSATVRRATFISVGFIALFYAAVTFIIVMAYGADNIQAAAKADPVNLVIALFDKYTSPAIVEVMNVLFLGSAFAALLALHNICNRYLFVLGRERLLPQALTRTSAANHAPWIAGTVQSLLAVVVVALVVVLGVDPYLGLLLWGSALGLVGIIVLWTVCAVAISAFLARQTDRGNVFETFIAPAIAFLGLAAVVVVVMSDLSLLTGTTGPVNSMLVALGCLAIVFGVLSAVALKKRDRQAYDRLGQNRDGIA